MNANPSRSPLVPPRVVRWQGRCYDFVALLKATPVELVDAAAAVSSDAQEWWEQVAAMAPGTAGAIIESVRH